jgi:hypothetical protein
MHDCCVQIENQIHSVTRLDITYASFFFKVDYAKSPYQVHLVFASEIKTNFSTVKCLNGEHGVAIQY